MNNEEKKDRRGSLALRGGLAAGTATAVLLGGFGAFSLWSDSMAAPGFEGDIASGTLDITDVTGGQWTIEDTDGDINNKGDAIPNIADFKASPGDIVEYEAQVSVNVAGSDLRAKLQVDDASYRINPRLDRMGLVTVDTTAATHTVDGGTGTKTFPVRVTVAFSDDMPGLLGQNLTPAVQLDGLAFELTQVH